MKAKRFLAGRRSTFWATCRGTTVAPKGVMGRHMKRRLLVAALAIGSALGTKAHAQTPASLRWRACSENEVQVLLLGVFHMAGERPLVDVNTPRRQAELDTLVMRLAAFAPAKVTVERPYHSRDTLNASYRAFRAAGGAPTTRNEAWQIGFRLARALGLDSIYPVDFRMSLGNDSLSAYYNRHPATRERITKLALEARRTDSIALGPVAELSLVEILAWMNGNAHRENVTFFRDILPLGEGGNYAGAEMVARWYERNLRIVQNILRVTSPSDRRILLIIGNGHVAPLKAIFEATPEWCPVSAVTLLSDPH